MRILGLTIARTAALEPKGREKQLAERVHRLEIALSEHIDHHNVLVGHFNKLRGIVHGDRSVRRGSQNGAPALDEIPFGDKAALRRALAGRIANARTQPQEQENG